MQQNSAWSLECHIQGNPNPGQAKCLKLAISDHDVSSGSDQLPVTITSPPNHNLNTVMVQNFQIDKSGQTV